MTEAPPTPTVLIPQAAIRRRVEELGAQITADYHDREVVLVCVLKGSFIFAADLARAIRRPVRIEFLGVQSYGDATKSSGVVQITQDLSQPVSGLHVLLVEDIVDTGLTAEFLTERFAHRRAASVKLATLLHKPARAKAHPRIDYLGFTVEDQFVVGYGLDAAQQYRNLPDLCVLQPDR